MRPSTRALGALIFCSGLTALVYQTAWQRAFRLVFGATTAASAAVLAVFLGGLGAGGLWLGRRAELSERPLVFYGTLEVGVAVLAALSPLTIELAGHAYIALGGVLTLGVAGSSVVRIALTALTVGPAVVLMGGTLPALARAGEEEGDRGRSRLALLYGVNTLGAVGGAVLATFALFEVFGVRTAVWVAALLNLLVGVIARALGREAEPVPVVDASATAASPAQTGFPILACAVAAGVGFAFLLLEIVWYRMLAPLLGGSTYTFGLVLAGALAGIGAGGFIYSLRGPSRPATVAELSVVTLLEALFVAIPIALGDRVALFAAFTRPIAAAGFPALVSSWAIVIAVVVLPAALVSGYQLPLLFALLGEGRTRVARHVGLLYAWNTAGSIAGSLLGGFVLIPRIGAVGSWRLVALLLTVIGVSAAVTDVVRRGRAASGRAALTLVLAAATVAAARAEGPTAVTRHEPIGAGRASPPTTSKNALRAWMTRENGRILWEADGIETAVALRRTDQLAFVVDGKEDGSTLVDRGTQAGSGLLAAILHPAPKRAFVVGLGTGMTAGWLSVVPGMERVDVAELEPSILEVARILAPSNNSVLARENVRVMVGDGRELVLVSREGYDVIVSEPSNPYRAGISSLYTREYYEAIRSRLRPRGIFVQWVQGYEIHADTIRTIARTLGDVLPYVEAWQPEYGDILFVASSGPRQLHADALRARLRAEPYRRGLPRVLLAEGLEGVLGRFLASAAVIRAIGAVPGIPVNTDDDNHLDYAFARTVGTRSADLPGQLLQLARKTGGDRPAVRGDVDWPLVEEMRFRAGLATREEVDGAAAPGPDAARRVRAVQVGCAGGDALPDWGAQRAGDPRDTVERLVLGNALAARGDADCLTLADALDRTGFALEATLVRARFAHASGDRPAALSLTLHMIDLLRHEPFPLCHAPWQALELVRLVSQANASGARRLVDALLQEPFSVYAADESRIATAQELAGADPATCVRALGAQLEAPRWERLFLERRLACLTAAKHPLADRALRDVDAYHLGGAGRLDTGP